LNDKVSFIGSLKNDEVINEMLLSDFYIQLSKELNVKVDGGDYIHAEGMGRTILEAISYGTYIITSRTGALPEIIESSNGVLLNDCSTMNVASAINQVMKNPPPKPKCTAKYSWENYFKMYENAW
ncbi:MAG TPA: glycosyltransferase, partial [Bacteroidia bacterium]|nr:glycosyltransferase [Bacteroidia bacterium]